jgi:hypothetical protein
MNSAHRAYIATTYVWRAKTPPESSVQMSPLAALRRDINKDRLSEGGAAGAEGLNKLPKLRNRNLE